jgi:hypothetical protein
MLFGAILAAVLLAPLYVAVPGRMLDDWYYVPDSAAMWLLLVALVVPPAAGFVAGWLDREAAVRSGTSAGFVTTIVGGMLVAVPASQVQATDPLLSAIKNNATRIEELRAAAADSAAGGTWIPVAVGLLLLVAGPALGAIGGVLFDLLSGNTGRTVRTVHRSSAPQFGLLAAVIGSAAATMWAIQLDLVVLPNLGHPVGWVDRSLLVSPLLIAAAVASLLLAWALRDAVLLWRSRLRLFSTLWGSTALGLAAAVPVTVLALYPQSAITPAPWLAMAALFFTTIGAVIGGFRTEVVLDPEARTFGEHVGHGIVTGLVVVATLVFVGGAPITGTWVITFPYVRALLSGAEAVQAQPERLVSAVYTLHWLAAAGVPVLAVTYATVFAPFWLFVRAFSRRD